MNYTLHKNFQLLSVKTILLVWALSHFITTTKQGVEVHAKRLVGGKAEMIASVGQNFYDGYTAYTEITTPFDHDDAKVFVDRLLEEDNNNSTLIECRAMFEVFQWERFWLLPAIFVGPIVIAGIWFFTCVSKFNWKAFFEIATAILAELVALAAAASFFSCSNGSNTDTIQIIATAIQIMIITGFETLISFFGILFVTCRTGTGKIYKLSFEVARWEGVQPNPIGLLTMLVMWVITMINVIVNGIYFDTILNPGEDVSDVADTAPKWAAIIGIVSISLSGILALCIPCYYCQSCAEGEDFPARAVWSSYKIFSFIIPGLFVASAAGDIRSLGWGIHLLLEVVNWITVSSGGE